MNIVSILTHQDIMKKYIFMLLGLAHMAYGANHPRENPSRDDRYASLESYSQSFINGILAQQDNPKPEKFDLLLSDVEAIELYKQHYPEDKTTGCIALLSVAKDPSHFDQWKAIETVVSEEERAGIAKHYAVEEYKAAAPGGKPAAAENLAIAEQDLVAALEDINTILPEIVLIANTAYHDNQWEAIKMICFSPAIPNEINILSILPGIISVANNSAHSEQWEAIKIICFADALENDSYLAKMMYFPDVSADSPVRVQIKTHMRDILPGIRSIAQNQRHSYQEYAASILAAPR